MVDSTANLDRVLRLPGSVNWKNPHKPVPVEIVEQTPTRLNPSEIEEALDMLGVPDVVETYQSSAHNFLPADLERIEHACAFMGHCREDAQDLSEPVWYAQLGIIARCQDGERFAHERSKPYPGYTPEETAQKLQHAWKAAGPRTCQYIRHELGAESYCGPCPHWEKISSPIQLGDPSSTRDKENDLEAARLKVAALREAAKTDPAQVIQTLLEDQASLHALVVLAEQERHAYEAFLSTLRGAGAKTRDVDALGRAVKEEQRRHQQEEREARHTQAEQQCAAQEQATGLPSINAGNFNLPQVTGQAWLALHKANTPPVLFRYGGLPTRIEMDDKGWPLARTVTEDRMRHFLANVANWFQLTKTHGYQDALPPLHVVRDMLARPDPPLPILERIVTAPVFAPNGTLQTKPGYHPASRTFLFLPQGCVFPEVPASPSQEELDRARILILDELLCDFPFVGEAERAHTVALLLLPFVRSLISGPTPLHLIEKATPGTGASLLVDMLAFPATGVPLAAMTEGRDEEEWRKRITAKLCDNPAVVFIDNLRRKLDCAAVAAVITATVWEDRRLGHSEIVRLPVQGAWVATGNNPTLSDEITRRTVRSRLDAKMDMPWLRLPQDFRHPELRKWAMAHRGELVWAALTLGRGWIAAGKPRGTKTLGMFEDWAEVMGGILEVAAIPGFLGNLGDFYQHSNTERVLWCAFITAWWDQFHQTAVGVSEVYVQLIITNPEFPIDLGEGNERSQKTRLGKLLGTKRDCHFQLAPQEGKQYPRSVRLVAAEPQHGANRWQLERVD